MTVALVTPPAAEPVSLTVIKEHLRITQNDEDGYLTDLLRAATQHVELASGRKLITQTWRRYVGTSPVHRAIPLHVGPVRTVEVVTVYDVEGTPSQLSPEDWRVIDEVLILDRFVAPNAANGIEIDVVCGYGDASVDVPDTLKRAILMLAAHWHEFRGAVAPQDQPVSLPPGFDTLVRPYRRVTL